MSDEVLKNEKEKLLARCRRLRDDGGAAYVAQWIGLGRGKAGASFIFASFGFSIIFFVLFFLIEELFFIVFRLLTAVAFCIFEGPIKSI